MEQKFTHSADNNVMYNYACWIDNIDTHKLKNLLEELLIASGHGIRGYVEEAFEPQGHTGAYILNESHFCYHQNLHQTYLELSSCNKLYSKKFVELFRLSEVNILKEFETDRSL